MFVMRVTSNDLLWLAPVPINYDAGIRGDGSGQMRSPALVTGTQIRGASERAGKSVGFLSVFPLSLSLLLGEPERQNGTKRSEMG
ncbi:hypothetical protein Y032_0042g637 [Ancylostoma ceylanicum]|uniref:Uncharacterized protein n=1 Tax=Ancylostoma ceylanicum TaxID=53326 RepID=A0A016UH93_9BILA|nr:hypothetical protein Y032_0042g637 [Ancylostoma ceylanicum]